MEKTSRISQSKADQLRRRYFEAQRNPGTTAAKRLKARKLSPELEALAKRYGR